MGGRGNQWNTYVIHVNPYVKQSFNTARKNSNRSSNSAARLNTNKSQGLWAGSWVGRVDRPLGFLWNSEGLEFLGVHLGNTSSYEQLNWKKCHEKLNKTLTSWKNLSLSLSFKGRILIANQLATSKTFHTLAVFSPPDHILDELQRMLIDFVWPTEKHHLKRQGGPWFILPPSTHPHVQIHPHTRIFKSILTPLVFSVLSFSLQLSKLAFRFPIISNQNDSSLLREAPKFL